MHTYTSSLFHCVFATKNRAPSLRNDLRSRLWPYLGGIARENGMKALAIGGAADHVHILLRLPATMPLAKALQLLKGNSSKWMHETFPRLSHVAWQEGYGAFSISVSGVDETIAYIRNQEQHHRTRPFRDEVRAMLKRHGFNEQSAELD
ncbi:MAG: IS200/IS605 family transposase [Verrucomicrobia bacterium]|nr:IS200/IS605 family transposase [Verrucomicrobiota bacterium]